MLSFARLERLWIEFSFRNSLMAAPDTGLTSNAFVVSMSAFIWVSIMYFQAGANSAPARGRCCT